MYISVSLRSNGLRHIHHQDLCKYQAQLSSYQTGTFYSTSSVFHNLYCPNSDRHMQSYLHQIHFFCLRKCPNQMQPCVAQPTVKSHWSKILLHTCKTSDFAFSMENLSHWVKFEHLIYGQHSLG